MVKLRAGVVGLGSMGKRRLRCLRALGVKAVWGADRRADRRAEAARLFGVAARPGVDEAALREVDLLIVSTPPYAHTPYIAKALKAGKPCFVEASVMLSNLPALDALSRRRRVLVFPSCTMRYFRGPRIVEELVSSGKLGRPLSFVYHSGQYLPDWHPWEKVSDYYVSRAETGACREIVPFELAWLTSAFGAVRGVKAQKAQKDRFGKGVEDVYQILLEFASGVHGMLQVDVLARRPIRRFALESNRGRLVWDQYGAGGPRVSVDLAGRKTRVLPVVEAAAGGKGLNSDGPYILELRDFLDDVRAKRVVPDYTLGDDVRVLKTLERIRRHCDERNF